MPNPKYNSKLLRQLAETIVQDMARNGAITDTEMEDMATSLVRQWISYEGNATFFFGQGQFYFNLEHTPTGPRVVPHEEKLKWLHQVLVDWKISEDQLPTITEQLNRGQCAEIMVPEGYSLRLWVNPKEKSKGVVTPTQQVGPPGWAMDHRDSVYRILQERLDMAMEEGEIKSLVNSVVNQWNKYQNHASIFIDSRRQFILRLTDKGIEFDEIPVDLEPFLVKIGFSHADIPGIISCINKESKMEFKDKQGYLSILLHDPKERVFHTQKKPLFSLGVTEIEERAALVLAQSGQHLAFFLDRHASGDWGEINDKARADNDHRLKNGLKVVSYYHTSNGDIILVGTTADRQRTLISTPDPEIDRDKVHIIKSNEKLAMCCPICKVVLPPWEENVRQRICPQCGQVLNR